MSRDPVLDTEYRSIPVLPLAATVIIVGISTLFVLFSREVKTTQETTITPIEKKVITTSANVTVTPVPLPTYPTPTSFPTLTPDQQTQLLEGLGGLEELNPPSEALDEIRSYFEQSPN